MVHSRPAFDVERPSTGSGRVPAGRGCLRVRAEREILTSARRVWAAHSDILQIKHTEHVVCIANVIMFDV